MKPCSFLSSIASSVCLAGLPYMAHAEWIAGTDVRWQHDNNVGDAAFAPDVVGDSSTDGKVSVSQFIPAASGYSLSIGADLEGELYDRLHGLNNASVDGAVSLRKKWGLGAYAPWARINASIGRTDYEDSYRSASVYRTGFGAGRRLDERWNFSLDWTFERRSVASAPEETPGISADAFSQTSHRLSLNSQFTWTEQILLNAAVTYRYGEMTSTVLDEDTAVAGARAQADDHAFGPEAYAYRLVAHTWGVRASLTYAPTLHHSFTLGFTRYDSHADGGIVYTKSTPEISWDYRF